MAQLAATGLAQPKTRNRLAGLWQLMAGFRLMYGAAAASLSISAGARTANYLLIRYFIDRLWEPQAITGVLWWIVAGFVGLSAIQGAFQFVSARLAATTAEGIALRLRTGLFDQIQELPFSFHDKTPTGELVQRATSDVDAVRRFFSEQAISIVRIVTLFLINVVALWRLNSWLALRSVIIIPVLVVFSALFFRLIARAYEQYQDQEGRLSTTLQENITGVRVVRAFARQDFEQTKFDRENRQQYRLGKQLHLLHAIYWPATDALCGLQMLGAFYLAALLALDGRISVGTYIAYHGLVVLVIWPMRNVGRLIVQISTAMVSFGRVDELLRQEREPMGQGISSVEKRMQGDLVFDHVGFAYDRATQALHDICFRCLPGQKVAVLGSTGSGKTTLVNLLARFYDYTGGHILLDGLELKEYSREYLRANIGIVEQEPFLFSRSIRDNIKYGVSRPVTEDQVQQAARAAAIHDEVLSFPQGYDTLLGERGVTLSGGQKQRVAIARILLKDPRILIMDDSTSSVDMETEYLIRRALRNLMRGRTTFVIAHRVKSLMDADLILVLDEGHIVQSGVHADLVQQPGMYRDIFEAQMQRETGIGEAQP